MFMTGFDCRKLTASMYASNFIIADKHLTHVRGQALLSTFTISKSIASHNAMTNHFCQKCGTLMYRTSTGFPDVSILRIGTVDDFNLHETKLKPTVEQFVECRVGWDQACEGAKQSVGSSF